MSRWLPGNQSTPECVFPAVRNNPKPMSSMMEVPVFYLSQDSSWEVPCRIVSRQEARRLKAVAAGSFIDNGRAFRLKESAPPPPLKLLGGPLETSATITLAELQANVGITVGGDVGTPADKSLVLRAQFKIAAYPFAWDKNSPLPFATYAQPRIAIAVAG
jgi:hypothetical protein